jgi:hypothetical protein
MPCNLCKMPQVTRFGNTNTKTVFSFNSYKILEFKFFDYREISEFLNELHPVSEKKMGVTRDVRRNGTGYPPGAANRLSTPGPSLLVLEWATSKLVMTYFG